MSFTKSVFSSLMILMACGAVQAGPTKFSEAHGGQYLARVQNGAGESAMIGSYAVRLYLKTIDNYVTGAISPRDGEIVGLWLVDLDCDDELEVLVWNRSGGSGSYGRIDRYRFAGNRLIRDDLPLPQKSMLQQYMGHDSFIVVEGVLQRSFPLYRPGDPNADPSGGSRTLVYRAEERVWDLAAPAAE